VANAVDVIGRPLSGVLSFTPSGDSGSLAVCHDPCRPTAGMSLAWITTSPLGVGGGGGGLPVVTVTESNRAVFSTPLL
jgi:hypothetical protein